MPSFSRAAIVRNLYDFLEEAITHEEYIDNRSALFKEYMISLSNCDLELLNIERNKLGSHLSQLHNEIFEYREMLLLLTERYQEILK